MDRKSFIILAVAVLLLFGLSPLVDHFFPPKPAPVGVRSALTNPPPGTAPAPVSAGLASPSPAPPPPSLVLPSRPERTLALTNDDLILRFTSHGGGLKSISLRKCPAVISRTADTSLAANTAVLNNKAPAPLLALLGPEAPQGDNYFDLTQNGPVVTAEKTLPNGLRLVKEFEIGSNSLFTARLRLENTSAQPLTLPAREVVVGTATPIGPMDDPTTLGTFWYNGLKAQDIRQAWFANRTLGCIPGTPRTVYEEGTNNVRWAAVHNQFFTIAAIPSNPAPRIVIHPVLMSPPDMVGQTNSTSALLTNGLETALWYPETNLAAHRAITGDFTFYAGPKEYNRLAKLGLQMNNNLDLIMDFSGFTGFFSKLLLLSLNGLHALGFKYGWAIIVITLIIKGVFWPLTRSATKSQKRLQALQPQMKAIADKYKDDPVKKNQKTMEFMKEHKVSPLGSCLPTAIQIPVFIGFYYMLRGAIELRGEHFFWIHDLSQPDTVAYLPFFGGFPVNPLPLFMGATQLWQQRLLPASAGTEPGQQQVMRWLPLIFVGMFYMISSGLVLYWTVSNLLSILQTYITKTAEESAKPPPPVPKKKV